MSGSLDRRLTPASVGSLIEETAPSPPEAGGATAQDERWERHCISLWYEWVGTAGGYYASEAVYNVSHLTYHYFRASKEPGYPSATEKKS